MHALAFISHPAAEFFMLKLSLEQRLEAVLLGLSPLGQGLNLHYRAFHRPQLCNSSPGTSDLRLIPHIVKDNIVRPAMPGSLTHAIDAGYTC